MFDVGVEYETLRADPARTVSQETRFNLLQKKLEVAQDNKKFYLYSLGGVIAIGIFMMFYGFKKWHTEVQPIQDEIARLSLEKLRREVGEDTEQKNIKLKGFDPFNSGYANQ